MKSLLPLVAFLSVAPVPEGGARHVLRVDLETAALSALPSTCFRTPERALEGSSASEQGLTWVLRDGGERGLSMLELGAPSFVLGDAGRVTLPQQLRGSDARFSFQDFQARVEGTSVITRHTSAELLLTPGEEGWTGTLTLSAADECRGGTCQLACEVVLPFTATPVPLLVTYESSDTLPGYRVAGYRVAEEGR
jgi:hypothetical protein